MSSMSRLKEEDQLREELGYQVAPVIAMLASPAWRPAKCTECGSVTPTGRYLDKDGMCQDCAPVTGANCRTAPKECEAARVVDWKRVPLELLERLRLCSGHATVRKRELVRRRGAA